MASKTKTVEELLADPETLLKGTYDGFQLFNTTFEPPQFIDSLGLISAGELNLLAGESGIGKSASGTWFINDILKNQPSYRVLDLNCEDKPVDSQYRNIAMLWNDGASWELQQTGADHLFPSQMAARYGKRYLLRTGSIFLDTEAGANLFRALCLHMTENGKYRCFIRIGPLSRVMRGSDTNDDAVKAAIEVLVEQKQLLNTVLLDTHCQKADPAKYKGSVEVFACADNFLRAIKINENSFTLDSDKLRHGAELDYYYQVDKVKASFEIQGISGKPQGEQVTETLTAKSFQLVFTRKEGALPTQDDDESKPVKMFETVFEENLFAWVGSNAAKDGATESSVIKTCGGHNNPEKAKKVIDSFISKELLKAYPKGNGRILLAV